MSNLSIETFKTIEANPGATMKVFERYVERIKLMNQLVFRKADGTPYDPSDGEKKAMLLFKGGDDMKNLFEYVGRVEDSDSFDQAIEKIRNGLRKRTNKVVQRNMLFTDFPQGTKSFEKWSQEISTAAQLISYEAYNWKQATVDAILLQTSSPKLRERALQEDTSYDALMTMGVAKEQSAKGAALLEQASGKSHPRVKVEEEVRRLQLENQRLRSSSGGKQSDGLCSRCGRDSCKQGSKCPANGQKCHKCGKENHLSKMCRSSSNNRKRTDATHRRHKKKNTFGQLSSAEESDSDTSGRIVVGHLSSKAIAASVLITGPESDEGKQIKLATDTGISKTLLNRNDWESIKENCTFVKTSKRFRPYGTAYHLPIKGKAKVKLTAERGASIETWVYVVDDKREQSLLGEGDAIGLGIVKLDLKGAVAEVVNKIEYERVQDSDPDKTVSDGETQSEIDANMDRIIHDFPDLFTDATGKVKGSPIKIQIRKDAVPVIQPGRKIPLHYMDRLKSELKSMKDQDIIEGPIDIEEPGTFISNLVITDKKDTDRIRITLDCQEVNKVIYPTHEPIPTSEELRHNLIGSDRFSTLDMTNCFHQFEIEEKARKLYAFRTPWGIFRYKRMVMGTSPASSEIQKRIRSIIQHLPNAIHIKDDILVHGIGREHDVHLKNVCKTLQQNGVTLRPKKCHLGQPSVRWFGQIYSKVGASPDPEKCDIIKEWPAPKSTSEVKSFLQTVQFNAKFMGGEAGEVTYPELTAPLRALTKKFARFRWGQREDFAFKELKNRLCSNKVLVPYDLSKKTRLYVDSSPIGTQATVCQLHTIGGEDHWRPVSHTSRPWTPAEAGYGQVERESNGICTGMYMCKMYTLGTHVEVVTDHAPLIPIYNASSKPKQLRVDRHRTKLLPFSYNVVYEEGAKTPCDYGSRHTKPRDFTEEQIENWCIETGTDIFVNRIIEDSLPIAVTLDMVRSETKLDEDMQLLSKYIVSHDKEGCRKNLPEFHNVFSDLTVIDGIVMKEHQLVIPESLRAEVIGLSHEGHQYTEKTLSLLRQSCWFPKMRKDVMDYVQSCVACLAAIPRNTPVPLEPNLLPGRAWQNLHADFKGPIGGQYYFHVLIDQFSKYPEVDIVTSTSFKKLRPKLDRIFSGQGIPETITADNGPPYPSHDMMSYAKEMGFQMELVAPEDPQGNGFAEIFVKILCKLIHTAIVEGNDPREVLHKYLMHYRATPHPTTGKSPAEMLNNRKIRTKLPQYFSNVDNKEVAEIREKHDSEKLAQKKQFDRRRKATNKEVRVGDQILVKQDKSTTKPPFDHNPYTVVKVDGNRIDAEREGKYRQRDKNAIKVVKPRPKHLVPSWNRKLSGTVADYDDFEIEGFWPSIPDETDSDNASQHGSDGASQQDPEYAEQALISAQTGSRPVNTPSSPDLYLSSNGGPGVGHSQDTGFCSNAQNGAIFGGGGFEPQCRIGQVGGKEHCNDTAISSVSSTLSYSPEPCRPRALKVGDHVAFKGKEDDDIEWFACTLVSRAGKAKGKFSTAWNIERDGKMENIDFCRDVGEYRLIKSLPNEGRSENTRGIDDSTQGTSADMNSHLEALIEAAMEREGTI